MPRPIAVLVVALLALRLVPAAASSSFSSSSGLRRRGDPDLIPNEMGRRGTPSLSSRRGTVRRRLAGLTVGRRRRNEACHDEGDDNDDADADAETSPPTHTNTTTHTGSLLRWYWQALRGPNRNDHNSNVVTDHSNSSNQDTAADRLKDAEGIFASGQAAVDDDDEISSRPSSSSPAQVTSRSSPPSASPTTSSPPATSSTCPENPSASLQVICQGGTVTFPTLCHAKQELGDALTDCLLLDTTPVESGNVAGNSAVVAVVAAASAPASQGEGSEAVPSDCPEGDDDPDDDGQGPLILCDGDMIFSSWCEAFRHHFARDECEEY